MPAKHPQCPAYLVPFPSPPLGASCPWMNDLGPQFPSLSLNEWGVPPTSHIKYMLTKCQLPSPAAALKPAMPDWLDPESRINLEIRWRTVVPRPQAVPRLPLQISCMFYGAKEWLDFFKENLSCRITTEMFVSCDPLRSKARAVSIRCLECLWSCL